MSTSPAIEIDTLQKTFRAGLIRRRQVESLGVSISYVSKVENKKLHFGDYPSETFVHNLAAELKADEDELLLLTDRVPEAMRNRIRQRPEVFNAVADLDDPAMDRLLDQVETKRP